MGLRVLGGGSGGASGVSSFNTRTGAVTLTKPDVTGTGLAAADVGAVAPGSDVTSFNTRQGAVTLSKADVTGTGLAPADIGALSTADRKWGVLAADLAAISAQTTLQSVTGLGLAISSSPTEIWRVTWWLIVNAANTTMDAKVGFAVPTGCTMRGGFTGSNSFGGWGPLGTASSTAAILTEASVPAVGTIAGTIGLGLGYMVFGGGTAGTVQVQYAQNTSDAGNLQVLKGSVYEAIRVAA